MKTLSIAQSVCIEYDEIMLHHRKTFSASHFGDRTLMTDENDRVEIPSTGDYVISCKHRCTEAVLTDIRDRLCFQKRKDNSCDL